MIPSVTGTEKVCHEHKPPDEINIEVKANQTDSTAGVVYAKGLSVIHLGMIIGWFYVIHPNHELAKELDDLSLTIDSKLEHSSCAHFSEDV